METVEIDAIAQDVYDRLREVLPAWVTGGAFTEEQIAEYARNSIESELRSFRREVMPETCPEVDVLGAAAVAKAGDLKFLMSGYRVAQTALWHAWFRCVEHAADAQPMREELLRFGSDYFFLYADLLSDYATDIFQREMEQMARNGAQRQMHAIRTLLEGAPIGDLHFDHNLEQHHLGLIAWGADAEDAVRSLAAKLRRPLLLVGPVNNTWWGWISGSRALPLNTERALRGFRPAGDAHIAVGLEAYGEDGFRASNRQAIRARGVSRATAGALIHYADVAVEALASTSEADARAFVAYELRGIDDDSSSSRRIRETLAAYFAAESNAASAAASLGIHQQTVANRLRVAEERLGQKSIGVRRVELEMALRLRASLTRADS
jgi:hypothetical protein